MKREAGMPVGDRSGEGVGQDPDRRLADGEYALFQRVALPRRLDAGERLFRRGDLGACMYVVAQGAVDLDSGDGQPGSRIGPRGFFGELALLVGDHARGADAIAVGEGLLLELQQDGFDRMAGQDPGVLAGFLRRAIQRVVRDEQALVRRLRRRNLELIASLDANRATAHRSGPGHGRGHVDALTGLPDQRALEQHLHQRRRNDVLAGRGLVLFDVDGLGAINDARGRLAGDGVLQGVAGILRSAAGPHDLACRLGDDTFCLLARADDGAQLLARAAYVVDTAAALQRLGGLPPRTGTLSAGACLVDPGATWPDWQARAGTALRAAVARGGNRVEFAEGGVAVAATCAP